MNARTIGQRAEFELSDEDFAALLEACKPVPYLLGSDGVEPMNPQERANMSWTALGDRIGFDGMTVEPISAKGDRFFSAVVKEPVAPPGPPSPLPDAEPLPPLDDAALEIPPKPLPVDAIFENAVSAMIASLHRDLGITSGGSSADYFAGINREILKELVTGYVRIERPDPAEVA